jgi:hypothetical protein
MSDEHLSLSVDPHGIESTLSTARIFSGVKFASGIRLNPRFVMTTPLNAIATLIAVVYVPALLYRTLERPVSDEHEPGTG